MSFFGASFFSLPTELVEEIIIICTLLGDPRAPSTLAQTCRHFRTLVYHQGHNHLWREMYLIFFDNPCPAIALRVHGRAHFVSHDFHWEDEYKLRIWTESFILKRTRPLPLESPSSRDMSSDLPSTDAEVHTALDTLLQVISTAAPLPYDSMASHYHPRALPHPHPIISPLLLAAHTQPPLFPVSRNTSWLTRILARGLPRVLMARLTSFDENGNVDIQKNPVKWDGLLMKLVAQVGPVMPINGSACFAERLDHAETGHNNGDDENAIHNGQNLGHEEAQDYSAGLEGEGLEENDEGSDIDEVKPATTSQDDVRRLARVRVYNMAYIHPSRSLGPFLPRETQDALYPSPQTTRNLGSGAVAEEEEVPVANIRRFRSPSSAVPTVPPIPDTNLDLDSIDVPPPLDDGRGDDDNDETQETGRKQDTGGDDDVAANCGDAPIMFSVFPLHSLATGLNDTRTMCTPSIQDDQLPRFDWAWLAAARQVIEFNLRDLLRKDRHEGVLRAFLNLDGLRSCSTPGFPPTAPEVMTVRGEGKGRRTFRDGEGWDWAGVEGQWRRCVCWLDYRDLIGNNAKPLEERFSDPGINEVMRIFPVTLRITRYSRPHPSWPGRPKIHFGGELYLGSTSVFEPDSGIRRLEGTVQMAASGDVRWSILSYRDDGQSRWWSEGVQIGGLGSAIGFLGMWTSMEHGRSNPIGPHWGWKVGPTVQ